MANIHPDIKPGGFNQKDLVMLLRAIVAGFAGICAKLDADDNTDNTYLAACYTAIFNVIIEDGKGNACRNVVTESSSVPPTMIINPYGISDQALIELLYQIHYAFKTLVTQIDADDITTSTYVSTCWNGFIAHNFENRFGTNVGYGTAYYFKPGGVLNHYELIDALYNFLAGWESMCEKLDTDAVPAGADYESLWYTNNIPLIVENSKGNVKGTASTYKG